MPAIALQSNYFLPNVTDFIFTIELKNNSNNVAMPEALRKVSEGL